jgi:hypothetical protein
MSFSIKSFIDYMIENNYYIIMIVDDLMHYYDFNITSDNVFKDIRTIELTHDDYEVIIIQSKIISTHPHVQHNKITYKKFSSNFFSIVTSFEWDYCGKCYKKK